MFPPICGVVISFFLVVNSGERVNTKPSTWKTTKAPEDELAAASASAAAAKAVGSGTGDEGDDRDMVVTADGE